MRVALLAVSWFCLASAAAAQSLPPLDSDPLSLPLLTVSQESAAERLAAVQQWTKDYEAWKAWFATWRNRREEGWFSIRDRRPRPVPPAWLGAACAAPYDDAGPMPAACRAWRDWSRDDYQADLLAQQVAQTRTSRETLRHTIWWERIHVDALWPMTQAGSSVFGVCGLHATLHMTERLQVFLAPGAILVRLPSTDGGSTWTPATDWGFSYRVMDFRVPAVGRPGTIHLNVARVWVVGQKDALRVPGDMYLAGFSVSFKRR